MKRKPQTKPLKAQKNPQVKQLAKLVGEFIEYWGFKQTHGEIWAYLHLSERPLSTRELIELVGVSKGAISHALNELVHFGVVEMQEKGLNGMTYYRASPDISQAISGVLRDRELKLLARISDTFQAAQRAGAFSNPVPMPISEQRAKEMGEWIAMAHTVLDQLVGSVGTENDPFVSKSLDAISL